MSALSGHVADYLQLRRVLGLKLEREGQLLDQFVDYLGAAGSATVTSELVTAWAQQPAGVQPNHWAKRLGVVRFRWLVCIRCRSVILLLAEWGTGGPRQLLDLQPAGEVSGPKRCHEGAARVLGSIPVDRSPRRNC